MTSECRNKYDSWKSGLAYKNFTWSLTKTQFIDLNFNFGAMIGGDGWIKIEVTEEIISSMEKLGGQNFF